MEVKATVNPQHLVTLTNPLGILLTNGQYISNLLKHKSYWNMVLNNTISEKWLKLFKFKIQEEVQIKLKKKKKT